MKPTNRVQAQMVTTLVAGATTAPTGALVGATNALGIANGQIGILEGNTLVTAPTGDVVKLVQGTPSSANIRLADPWGVKDPAIVETDYIYKDKIRNVQIANYFSGCMSSAFVNGTGVTITAGKTYQIAVELDGMRQERRFNAGNDVIVASHTAVVGDTLDIVLKSLYRQLNAQSKIFGGNKNYVVFGTGTTTTGGAVLINTMTTASALAMNATTTYAFSNYAHLRALYLDNAIDGLYLQPEANAFTGLVVLGLEAEEAVYFDDVQDVYTTVKVSVEENAFPVTDGLAIEPVGTGRKVWIENRNRAQLNIHTKQNHPHGEFFSEGISYLDKNKNYGALIVEYYDYESTLNGDIPYEKTAIVYFEQAEAAALTPEDITLEPEIAISPAAPANIANFVTWATA